MSKGPQTFQSQALPGVILDLDPREGVGSENGKPKPFQPGACMDVCVRGVSRQSRCAGDRLFPIILETVAGVPTLACARTSLSPGRLQIDRCVCWSPTGLLPPVPVPRRERLLADRPGLNSGSSETDPNLRDPECLGQGCHNSTQSRVLDDGHAERAHTYDWGFWGRVGPVPAPFAYSSVGIALEHLIECQHGAAGTRSDVVYHCGLACRAHSDSRRRCGSQEADREGSSSLVYCRHGRRLPGRGEEGLREYVSLETRGKQRFCGLGASRPSLYLLKYVLRTGSRNGMGSALMKRREHATHG